MRASLLRGIGAPAARRVVRAADARSSNPFESVLRAICLEFPELEMTPQKSIAAEGVWAVVDLGDVRLRLVIEAEGFEFHGTRKGLVRDCRRYTELTALGWAVLRFTWEDVMLASGLCPLGHPDVARPSSRRDRRTGTRRLSGPNTRTGTAAEAVVPVRVARSERQRSSVPAM